jgi:hypothetical protein
MCTICYMGYASMHAHKTYSAGMHTTLSFIRMGTYRCPCAGTQTLAVSKEEKEKEAKRQTLWKKPQSMAFIHLLLLLLLCALQMMSVLRTAKLRSK